VIGQELTLQSFNLRAFLVFVETRADALDLRAVEDARTDKQIGAPAGGSGSSNAVSKGSVPAILGFAVENGALTETVSGTTMTLRGNLVGWLDLFQNQGFIAAYQDDSALVRQLRRVSYSFTLNPESVATPEEAAPGGASGGGFNLAALRDQLREAGQQLAGYSVRLALWDQRDPRNSKNRAALATSLGPELDAALAADAFLDPIWNSDEYNFKWRPETVALLNDPTLSAKGAERLLYRQLEVLRLYMLNRIDRFEQRVGKAITVLDGYDKARVKAFQAIQKRPLFAFEFVGDREKDVPDRLTSRFIFEGQWGPRIDLTANIAWTFQGASATDPARSGSDLRDFQAAAQMEIPLASAAKSLLSTSGIGTPYVAIAYLSRNLTDTASVTFAGNTFTLEPGWIHAVQARLTLPVKGSGVKIPVSISYANRTELLKEKSIRGHIGMTFDLDVLSSLRR
jgi:hypothetical protein